MRTTLVSHPAYHRHTQWQVGRWQELFLAHGTFGISLDMTAGEFLSHIPPTIGEVGNPGKVMF